MSNRNVGAHRPVFVGRLHCHREVAGGSSSAVCRLSTLEPLLTNPKNRLTIFACIIQAACLEKKKPNGTARQYMEKRLNNVLPQVYVCDLVQFRSTKLESKGPFKIHKSEVSCVII